MGYPWWRIWWKSNEQLELCGGGAGAVVPREAAGRSVMVWALTPFSSGAMHSAARLSGRARAAPGSRCARRAVMRVARPLKAAAPRANALLNVTPCVQSVFRTVSIASRPYLRMRAFAKSASMLIANAISPANCRRSKGVRSSHRWICRRMNRLRDLPR